MSDNDRAPDPDERPHGLFDSLKALLSSMIGAAHGRLDLLGTELEEQAARLTTMLVWGVVALSLTLAALLLCVMALIVIFWDTHRVLVAAGSAVLFIVLAAGAIYAFVSQANARPRLFAATLDELAKDRERLSR